MLINDKGIRPMKRIVTQVIKALTIDEVKVQLFILDSDFEFEGMDDANLRTELTSRVKILINEAKNLSPPSTPPLKTGNTSIVTPRASPKKARGEIIFEVVFKVLFNSNLFNS